MTKPTQNQIAGLVSAATTVAAMPTPAGWAMLAVQMLPVAETGVEHLIAWIESLRSMSQQSGEWTKDHEQQYRTALWSNTMDPKYEPAPAAGK
jgi:putative protein kinase ArgK-like GTPase of G3E family